MKRETFILLLLLSMSAGLLAFTGIGGNVNQQAGLIEGAPGRNVYPSDQPGETKPLPRGYAIAPPVIPHSVAGMEVSRDSNDCLGCHLEGVPLGEGHVATRIPSSHFVNEHTGEKKKKEPVGIRHNCLQCHVPQAEGEPHMR